MTIKELYELACAQGKENYKIMLRDEMGDWQPLYEAVNIDFYDIHGRVYLES